MEEVKAATPIADCIRAMVTHERDSRDGMSPVAIRLGRVQRSFLNGELRGVRGFKEIKCPNADQFDEQMGAYGGLPVYVVDEQSLIEIVLEKDAVEEN